MVEVTGDGGAPALPRQGERLRAYGREFAQALRGQDLPLAAMAVYVVLCYLAAQLAGAGAHFTLSLYSSFWLKLMLGLVFVLACVVYPAKVLLLQRPARPARAILDGWKTRLFTAERLGLALPMLLALPVFVSAFSSMKMMIPAFHPYTWDPAFAELDRWLHGGIDPWRLLQPVFGHPLISFAVNVIYNAGWFVAIYAVLLWQVFQTSDRRRRSQFFVCFVLMWGVLGTAMASLFASGGPCYYGGLVAGANPFAPLMDYLYAANERYPIWALSAQELLWEKHVEGDVMLGGGISAMPSLHVACAMLCALVAWRYGRAVRIAMALFVAAMLLGSVHLGWHYAIDGYLSVLAMPLLWRAAGWMVDRWDGLRRGTPAAA